jgi:hypothetical protein
MEDYMMAEPDATVAEKIIISLREKGLLSEKRLIGLQEKLSAGNIDAGDWRLLAELDGETEAADGNKD